MIKIELEVTPEQLEGIAALLSGRMRPDLGEFVTGTLEETTDTPPPPAAETTSTAGSLFAENEAGKDVEAATTPATTEAPPPPATEDAAASGGTEVELGKGMNGQMIAWDARIHGKAKKKNADGSWRLIQGVDRDTLVPQVEAELVAALAASPESTTPAPATGVDSASATPSTAAAADTPPPPADDVPPPPASRPTTFAELLPLVTTAKANGTLTDEQIAKCCESLSLPNFGMIATRPDLIETAAEILGV